MIEPSRNAARILAALAAAVPRQLAIAASQKLTVRRALGTKSLFLRFGPHFAFFRFLCLASSRLRGRAPRPNPPGGANEILCGSVR